MEHLSLFGIKNFRVFDDQEGFLEELAPITLITGANNSGKSSILKALVMLKDSINSYKDVFELDFSGDRHFLGDIANVLYEKENNRITISLPFYLLEIKSLFISMSFDKTAAYQATLSKISIHDKLEDVEVFSAEYKKVDKEESEADWEVNKAEYDNDRQTYDHFIGFLEGYIHWNINWIYLQKYLTTILTLFTKYQNHWTEEQEKKRRFRVNIFSSFLEETFTSVQEQEDIEKFNFWDLTQFLKKFDCVDDLQKFVNTISSKSKDGIITIRTKDFEPTPETPTIGEVLFWYTKKIIDDKFNLGGEKESSNAVILKSFQKTWNQTFSFIEKAVYLSAKRGDTSRIYFEAKSPFKQLLLDYDRYVESNRFSLFEPFIEKWLREFDIADSLFIKSSAKYGYSRVEVVYKDGTKRDLIDFGYGVMNLIIIFIQIEVLAAKNYLYEDNYQPSIFFLEEPETNLHPKWQSLLAEVFWEASQKFNIQFLIETHSEYLIRRFQTLIAEDKAPPKDIKILYLRNPKYKAPDKKQVESIAIQEDGSIDYEAFDSGFFDEQDKLELSLLNIQRNGLFNELDQLKKQASDDEERIKVLEKKIDEFSAKLNLDSYKKNVENFLGSHKAKILPNSIIYFASAKYILNTFGTTHQDYSPMVIQCGRIVEGELLAFFEACKIECLVSDVASDYVTPAGIRTPMWSYDIRGEDVGLNRPKTANSLKWHHAIQNDISFNHMWDTLSLLYCNPSITTNSHLTANGYEIVNRELISKFITPSKILDEDFLHNLRVIVDKRNESAHTYEAPVSHIDALKIMQYTEVFVRDWVMNKK